MSSDDDIPFGADTMRAPPRITVRNETDLALSITGCAMPDGSLCVVARVAPDSNPSACTHPVGELHCPVAGQPIEWCRCCGSYRVFEHWISPQGSLQHRAWQMGKFAAALRMMQERIATVIGQTAQEVRGL
jgi:hypothetical protein